MDEYEWNSRKAAINLQKHEVSFAEASTIFDDPRFVIFGDPVHSHGEVRYIAVGMSDQQRVLFVAYTERGINVRIISAREATNRERKRYEEEI